MIRDAGRVLGRGLAFPPRLGPDGRMAFSDGAQNIRESIQVILLTELSERLYLPDFGGGLRAFLYEPNIVTTHRLIEDRAQRALVSWEPRIRLEAVTVTPDPEDAEAAILTVAYRLVATNEPDRLSLTLQLAQ